MDGLHVSQSIGVGSVDADHSGDDFADLIPARLDGVEMDGEDT